MEDSSKLTFENKLNNNFFKYLNREFLSNSTKPSELLKLILKLLFVNNSKSSTSKYVSLFFQIISRILENSTDEKKRISLELQTIINETVSKLIKSKNDNVVAIKYLIFLLEHKEFELAYFRSKDFLVNKFLMNNWEILLFQGISEFLRNKNSNETIYASFVKSIKFSKTDVSVIGWIINFLIRNKFYKEVSELLEIEKVKEYLIQIHKNTNSLIKYKIFTHVDYSDSLENKKKVINDIVKEINEDPFNIDLILRLDEFITELKLRHKSSKDYSKLEKLLIIKDDLLENYLGIYCDSYVINPFNQSIFSKTSKIIMEILAKWETIEIIERKKSLQFIIENFWLDLRNIVIKKTIFKRLISHWKTNLKIKSPQEIKRIFDLFDELSSFIKNQKFFSNFPIESQLSESNAKIIAIYIKNLR